MSSVLIALAFAAAVAMPVSYLCSRRQQDFKKKMTLSTLLWVVFLSIPLYYKQKHAETMPIHSAGTMILAVLAFMFPLKFTQLILFPHDHHHHHEPDHTFSSSSDKKESQHKSNDDNGDKNTTTFLSFTASFLFYLLPISRTKQQHDQQLGKNTMFIFRNLEYLIVIVGKIVILPVLEQHSILLVKKQQQQHDDENDLQQTAMRPLLLLVYMKLLFLFSSSIIASSWFTDLQCLMVHVLSAGRFEMLDMHNYPAFSTSLRDFWGRRYNALIHVLLKDTVYIPMMTRLYPSEKAVAAFDCFLVSGLLHSYVAYFTFGRGMFRALVFFLSQALWIRAVESSSGWFQKTKLPWLLQVQASWIWFMATLPLYSGLFVEVMPDWLEKNPVVVPRIPILSDFARKHF